MDKLLWTAVIAIIGGLTGIHLKIPAGALIGSMIAVGIYNIFLKGVELPAYLPVILQIAAGAMIGSRITKETIMGLKDIWLAAVVIVIGVVIINFGIGFLIARFTGMDMATALFASAPGGLTEMTLAANEMGADTPKVALLQLLRLVSVIALLPVLLRLFLKHIQWVRTL